MKLCEIDLTVNATPVHLSYLHRVGTGTPLVCLHGFGSTKEDYADLALRSDFENRELVFVDAPGFGASSVGDPSALSIPFLVATARAFCDHIGLSKFHLLGHSMGGLTALMLARDTPDRVASFINIEGNIAPEDCFLSRQIIAYPASSPQAFLDGFIQRVSERDEFAAKLYALGLATKVRAESAPPVFRSMVELSDTADLMGAFGDLPCPRLFVYGEQNRHLSYLNDLPSLGVQVCEIAHAGHFPMYANPPRLWDALSAFLTQCERQ